MVSSSFDGPEGQSDLPFILAPGPVTTSRRVKLAMLADYATHDDEFISNVKELHTNLLELVGGLQRHACVLLQGPGMFAIEAALSSFAPQRRKKTLLLVNGKHGHMVVQIMQKLGKPHIVLERKETQAFSSGDVDEALASDADITHVWATQCEASSGLINPIAEIAALVKARGKIMMVDCIASFGAVPLDVSLNIDVLVSTSGNAMESVPGISWVIVDKAMLAASEGKALSFCFDLHANWAEMELTGQFRLTPSTHAILALQEAVLQFHDEGGVHARYSRYQAIADSLNVRMKAMGFVPVFASPQHNTVVQSYYTPRDSNFSFADFSKALRNRGFLIAAGSMRNLQTFRLGVMGAIDENVIVRFAAAMAEVLQEQNIRELNAI